jgi:hypothetical protein
MKLLTAGIVLLALAATMPGLAANAADYRAVLADIDRMSSFADSDFSCQLTVVSEKPGEQPNIQQAQMFRRDGDQKAVILILKPAVQKGQGYLQVGESLWFYDPESRKFAHTALKENFQDTDAKHSDFRPPALERDYRVAADAEGELGRFRVYVLDLEAVSEEVFLCALAAVGAPGQPSAAEGGKLRLVRATAAHLLLSVVPPTGGQVRGRQDAVRGRAAPRREDSDHSGQRLPGADPRHRFHQGLPRAGEPLTHAEQAADTR